ncbi:MAG: acetate--CoA ligase family protein [Albidovulum sp.]|nr:acetate--CoA ligase family protein [Albidovulum sp.]
MNFEEWAAKRLLAERGIAVPGGRVARTPQEASSASQGSCVVKAQIPAGARGKSGGVRFANGPDEAALAAESILGTEIAGFKVEKVLVEERVVVERELYAAVLTDRKSRGPAVLFSPFGGIDIEETAASDDGAIRSVSVDILRGFDCNDAESLLGGLEQGELKAKIGAFLESLYSAYRDLDADLLEINPLAVAADGEIVALDCKFALDDSASARRPDLASQAARENSTVLETEAANAGLRLIELGGSVGVLANGAGLTMATMDSIAHFGGRPANFLEIGGDSYTKAELALRTILKIPNVKCLLVNFCGAFARTDVMARGVVTAWKTLQPPIPAFFSVHGTGEDEAIQLIRDELGFSPYESMDEAVKDAVAAAAQR